MPPPFQKISQKKLISKLKNIFQKIYRRGDRVVASVLVPRMIRIGWPATCINTAHPTCSFIALLDDVVVRLAQWLPIIPIPEQLRIALMFSDMIDYDGPL